MENLTLNVKKKWFDMMLSGEKKEEYRGIKPHWQDKIYNYLDMPEPTIKHFDTITILNGMKKNTPKIVFECKGIIIGNAVPEWSDNWKGEVFVIKLGNIIETKNI
jgi:hypothetical protein